MKLFTKDINQKLFAQYRIGSNLNNQKVVAKIFNPYGEGRWYLLNSDPNDPDYLWAIVQMGDNVEIGSVSRSELERVRVKPFGLPLERDIYFTERIAMEVLEGLEKGKTFAAGGMTAGRWYKDNSGKEFRYIGESQGKLLFNDGEKIIQKDEEDFNDSPKERGLFGFFEEGGETEEGVDLFEDYDDIPDNVQEILQKYDFEDADYRTLEKAKKDVETVGYTFEYSLDGTAYDLRKIGQKGKSEDEDEYAKGGLLKISMSDIEDSDFQSLSQIFESNDAAFYIDESEEYVKMDLKGLSDGDDKEQALEIIGKYDVKRMAKGGNIDWGADLGDGFSVGNDVKITDTSSRFWNKYGYLVGKIGQRLVVRVGNDEMDAVVGKDKVQKLDAPMAKGGSTPRTVKMTLSDKDSYDYTYKQDGATASITFGFGKEPFQYEVKKISKSLEPLKQDILDAFTIQGIKQHEYKGGFSEAIKHLDTKVVYEDNFAKGGVTSKAGSPLKDDELSKMYQRLKTKKDEGSKLDANEEYALKKSEYLLKNKGLLKSNDKMADGGEMDSDDDDIDYNSISDLQSERNRLVRWSNQYGSKGADYTIKKLEERIEYLKSKDPKMADGGETKINLGLDKNGKPYKVGDIISLRAYMYEIMKDNDGKIILSQLDSYYAPFGKNYQVGSPQFNDILKQGVIFSNRRNKMAKGGETEPFSKTGKGKFVSTKDRLNICSQELYNKDYEDCTKEQRDKSFDLFLKKYAISHSSSSKMAKGGKLVGKQKNLDVNKNGKLDAEDFKMLRGEKMAMGGKVKFEDKVKAIKESLLKRKKVSPKVQKDYGKTYSPKEAEESAKRIAGALRAKYDLKKKFKKGGKTIAQTPAPKKDRVFGSSTNKPGSASSKKTASKIELNEIILKTLSEKAKTYNEKHSSKVSTSTLKAVMRRGMGAYSTSHRPTISGGAPNSRQAWGFARVNKFLLKKGGTKVKAAYVQDDDLL